jgi:hypothetical protein
MQPMMHWPSTSSSSPVARREITEVLYMAMRKGKESLQINAEGRR